MSTLVSILTHSPKEELQSLSQQCETLYDSHRILQAFKILQKLRDLIGNLEKIDHQPDDLKILHEVHHKINNDVKFHAIQKKKDKMF